MMGLYEQLLGNRPSSPADGVDRREQANQSPAGACELIVGAAISYPGLAIVALKRTETGWEWLPGQSHCFVLDGNGQKDFRQLAWKVDAYVHAKDLRAMHVREPTGSGPMRAAGGTHRLLAMLLLTPGLNVDVVNVQAITAWRRREGPDLPRPTELDVPRGLGKPIAFDLHDRAIECAAFVDEAKRSNNHG